MSFDEVFRIVGLLVCWGVAIVLGLVVFLTLVQGILGFASTGIGAIILALLGFKLWRDFLKKNE